MNALKMNLFVQEFPAIKTIAEKSYRNFMMYPQDTSIRVSIATCENMLHAYARRGTASQARLDYFIVSNDDAVISVNPDCDVIDFITSDSKLIVKVDYDFDHESDSDYYIQVVVYKIKNRELLSEIEREVKKEFLSEIG